ncbi:MAG: hypothetical protein M1832_000458 [Thelocarpon impressellum]|nr:MAG: hypothetical protein M1832_000458 [Thelocarpon impressellum]
MRISEIATAVALAGSVVVEAKHSHLDVFERRHQHHRRQHQSRSEVGVDVQKRTGQCQFPTDAGLVAVTPGSSNAGWAMSPDQPCKPGNYCPYACPPGELMAQWDPKATAYTYPQSQNGGLYCDNSGKISKPFPEKPYCVKGTGSIGCKNEAGGNVAVCQTVLPGNEAMLIPTDVSDWAGLAVPDPSYWASTAAHFYINPPGVSVEEGCVWGTKQNPVGNWSPYVAGANTDANGQTFVKLGWNPIYLEPATPFRNEMPKWGVKIECEGGGCNGLPCGIDPSKQKVNECSGKSSTGAGDGNFCVVTVPKGSKANIVVFGEGAPSKSGGDKKKSSSAAPSFSAVEKKVEYSSTSSSSSSYSSTSSSSSYSSTSTTPSSTPTSTHKPSSTYTPTSTYTTTAHSTSTTSIWTSTTSTNSTTYYTPSSTEYYTPTYSTSNSTTVETVTPTVYAKSNLTATYVTPLLTSTQSSPTKQTSVVVATTNSARSLSASAVGAGLSAALALLALTL